MVSSNQGEVLLALLNMLIQSCTWKVKEEKCLLNCLMSFLQSEPRMVFVDDKKYMELFSFNLCPMTLLPILVAGFSFYCPKFNDAFDVHLRISKHTFF